MKIFTQEIVEKISDDFQSTFLIVDDYKVSNLFEPKDIPDIKKVITKYLGPVELEFKKTNALDSAYDIYLIVIKGNENDRS